MQSVLRADLAYISLALIQRNSFDEIATRERHYAYKEEFIARVVKKIDLAMEEMEKSSYLFKNLKLAKG
jgi:hypothetical protein